MRTVMKNGLLRAPLFLLSMDMNSHEIDYELIGDDMQIVEIELTRVKRLSLKLER